ncbi:MAG: hypothetical protein Q8K32_03700 [Archangium sp.]|nr:hypothetical protein [Archangium sp.]
MKPAQGDPERRFAIFAALSLPWLMLLVTDWTVTPVGMLDAWIYRALGRDLVNASVSLGDYYYSARPFVLVPRYLLTRFLLEGAAHTVYGLFCAHVVLFAVLDLLTGIARPSTRLTGVLLFGTCMYLLRSLGWGYIDGSLLTWFMVGLAGIARRHRPGTSARNRFVAGFVAGGCFAAMLLTHPMSLPMLLTPAALVVWLHQAKRPAQSWVLCIELAAGAVSSVVVMGCLCFALYGRFFFFGPIIDAALAISSTSWKQPIAAWWAEANWVLLLGFAWLAATCTLVMSWFRHTRLTGFELFAYGNLVLLMTLMAIAEIFSAGYWLQYAWFASYFLPAALLALAALLGERASARSSIGHSTALMAVLVVGSALAYRLEIPFILPPLDDHYRSMELTLPWWGTSSLAGLQAFIAAVALAGIMVWRSRVNRPRRGAKLLAAGLIALVLGAPINRVSSGDAIRAEAAASVARAIVLIQDELKGQRPAYWFDEASPLSRLFLTISSAHLAFSSSLESTYPRGARCTMSNSDGSHRFFETGDPVVILDVTTDRFERARQSFSEIGIAMTETRRVRQHHGEHEYWIIFATLTPRVLVLQPSQMLSLVKGGAAGERISERERGYLAYGPYVRLGPGAHRVTFHLQLLDEVAAETVIASVDAADFFLTPARVFGSTTVRASDALSDGTLDAHVDFTLREEVFSAEFRVITEGNARLALRSIEVQRPERVLLQLPDQAPRPSWNALASREALSSTSLKTSGLSAEIVVDLPAEGKLSARAILKTRSDSLIPVELGPGDTLTATLGDTTREMMRQGAATEYTAQFDNPGPGTPVQIAFSRNAEVGAPASTVRLPRVIAFTTPASGTRVPRTAGLTVRWNPWADERQHLIARGDCIERVDAELDPLAESHLLAGFKSRPGHESETCAVLIEVYRSQKGLLDPAWGLGGRFEATTSRTVSIQSIP